MVSVIVPCYNAEDTIQETIHSLLNQTYKNIEIIVVDDASIDKSKIILQDLFIKNMDRITLVHHSSNKGVSSTLNTGIKTAKGDYILILGSDDLLATNYIEKCIKHDYDIVSAHTQCIGNTSETRMSIPLTLDIAKIVNPINYAALVKKSVYNKVGLFDENMIGYEDWEFWIRCAKANCTHTIITDTTFFYRIRSNTLLSKADDMRDTLVSYIHAKHLELYI